VKGDYNTLHEWEEENPQDGKPLTLVLREMLRKCGEDKVNMQTYVVRAFLQLHWQTDTNMKISGGANNNLKRSLCEDPCFLSSS